MKNKHTWNYRVLAHQSGDETIFEIYEVFYEKGDPKSHSTNPANVLGSNMNELKGTLSMFKSALKKPVLWYGKKFPKRFE